MLEVAYVLVSPAEYEQAKAKALLLAEIGIMQFVFHCPLAMAQCAAALHQGLPEKPLYEREFYQEHRSLESGQITSPGLLPVK